VDDRVDALHRLRDARRVLDAALRELDALHGLKVLSVRCFADKSADGVPGGGELLGDVAPEEAAGACDKDLHRLRRTLGARALSTLRGMPVGALACEVQAR
jgi:hypothetical protein